jgi:hypothetical protein
MYMSLKLSKIYFGFLVMVLAVTGACSVSQRSTPAVTGTPIEPQPSQAEATASVVPTISLALSATPTIQVAQSPTVTVVTVTAMNGDVSIRSGPDLSFDAVARLKNSETATALARSIIDGWVQIPIPSQAGRTGWVSTKTSFSVVSGNVLDLPRIDIVEWNFGSYLRNCTPHRMFVQPGDMTLQPVSESPNNRVWFAPGSYTVYDLDVAGQPVAANLIVLEHSETNILKDGNRRQWNCP